MEATLDSRHERLLRHGRMQTVLILGTFRKYTRRQRAISQCEVGVLRGGGKEVVA